MTDDLNLSAWVSRRAGQGTLQSHSDYIVSSIEELEGQLVEARRVGKEWFEEQKKARKDANAAEAKLEKQENIIAAGKEMYETAMLTGGGSPVAWTAYVKARNTFGDTLAELKGDTE